MSRIYRVLATSFLVLWCLAVGPSTNTVWDSTYEDDPENTDAVNQGDDWMRKIKLDVRERAEVEMHFGDDNADDNGLMRLGSARCFIQDAAPTVVEQAQHHNDGTAGAATLSTASFGGGGSELLGEGRCWIDIDGGDGVDGTGDDFTLWVYDRATAGWVQARAPGNAGPAIGQDNLLYNGDFEIGGDGGTGTPAGWTILGSTPTFLHNDLTGADTTEGVGLAVTVTDSGIGGQGITQALNGLKASTSYLLLARVKAAAGDTCRIDVTGEASQTNLPDTSATTGSFEGLVGTFTTNSTPSAVTVQLLNPAAGDVCAWDHVGAYEIQDSPVPSTRGFLWNLTSSSTESNPLDADFTVVAFNSPTFEVPKDNCYAKVNYDFKYQIIGGFTGGDDIFTGMWRLQYDNGGGFVDMDEQDVSQGGLSFGAGAVQTTALRLEGVTPKLTAGAILDVRLRMDGVNLESSLDLINLYPTTISPADTKEHRLWIEMVCH